MHEKMLTVRGDIPAIIRNDANLYDGSLRTYFREIVRYAKNLDNPYHNFRHLFHTIWLCYDACVFYSASGVMSKRDMRNLLIAGMVHDVDHTTVRYPDLENIKKAIEWIERHIIPWDTLDLKNIVAIVKETEYPYLTPSEALPLQAQILRDADAAQTFSPAWIQQVVFGLSAEWNKPPLETLYDQLMFLHKLKFTTAWAQERFPVNVVREKIAETEELIDIII